eukprot:5333959-Pyramimonas_sp.AAC.1
MSRWPCRRPQRSPVSTPLRWTPRTIESPQGSARGAGRCRSTPLTMALLSPGPRTNAKDNRLGGKPGLGRDGRRW